MSINLFRPKTNIQVLILLVLVYSLSLVIFRWIPGLGIPVIISLGFYYLILSSQKKFPIGGFCGVIYLLLLIWSLVITFSTFTTHIAYTKDVLGGNMLAVFASPLFLPNFLPFILLFLNKRNFDIKYLISVCGFLSIIYMFFYPFAFYNMIHFSWDNSINLFEEGSYMDFVNNSTLGIRNIEVPLFMFFLYRYIDNKLWRRFAIVALGSFLLILYMARRGAIAMSLLNFIACWAMYAFTDKKTSKFKMVLILLLIVSLGYLLFAKNSVGFLGTLLERFDEDSRSAVEYNFWLDILKDDSIYFGRGWFGEYYDPLFGRMRPHIETGYMSLILRGGVIYLFLYVSLLLISSIKGIFFSKNILARSFGIVILLSLVALYPSGYPKFSLEYIIIWMGVFFCNQKSFRQMHDTEIKTRFI